MCATQHKATRIQHLPCRHRVVRFLCTPPIRRTGSIPSCVCACAGPPRGLDQSVGTQHSGSAPCSPSPTRETEWPRGPGLCICLSNTTPSSGPAPKRTKEQKLTIIKKSKAEMSKPSGFYPQSPDPLFHQAARAVRPSTRVKLCILVCCSSFFFPDWGLKVG